MSIMESEPAVDFSLVDYYVLFFLIWADQCRGTLGNCCFWWLEGVICSSIRLASYAILPIYVLDQSKMNTITISKSTILHLYAKIALIFFLLLQLLLVKAMAIYGFGVMVVWTNNVVRSVTKPCCEIYEYLFI